MNKGKTFYLINRWITGFSLINSQIIAETGLDKSGGVDGQPNKKRL